MRRLGVFALTIAAAALAWSMAGRGVEGRGKFEFDAHEHGVGTMTFEMDVVSQGKHPTGRVLIAGEGIHIGDQPLAGPAAYPDIVVDTISIDSVSVLGNRAVVKAHARLHFDPVNLTVTATDSRREGVEDRLRVHVEDPGGTVLFDVQGPLLSGHITIR